ncbi:hypothetical protein F2Q68_00006107 [Brassica cretica]|uniref:Uncharacterized protein n=1 Tax=Brassica cretica TaxID=69181 RepID=A0A8S9JGW2_BRACR|nr:hypothetical protein F2Q68_00006107 [Brassica cretica]
MGDPLGIGLVQDTPGTLHRFKNVSWKPPPAVDQEVNSPSLNPQQNQLTINLAPTQHEMRELERQQMRELLLEDINQATQQYLNCPDPTEAAARRLRVLASEKRGQVGETV